MRRFLPATAALLLTACGYVAGPLAPLANVPARVADLAAVQRGSNLIVQFTVPHLTTEGRVMKEPPSLDLRIGPGPDPFDADRWAAAAKAVPQGANKTGPALYQVPAGQWIGREVVIAVRVTGANGKEDGWSSWFILPVVVPPEQPREVQGEIISDGVHLTWKAGAGHFHVLRAIGDSDRYALVATVTEPQWTDSQATFGTRYRYIVYAFAPLSDNREAQSELSVPFAITPEPLPPSAPKGLRAIAAPNSIELAWDTNPEEIAGYRIYRSVSGGALEKLAESGAVPTYSDHAVEHGKTYRYAVTALGPGGKESAQSAVLQVALP